MLFYYIYDQIKLSSNFIIIIINFVH